MLYVGSTYNIYKLDAGIPSALPKLLQTLPLDAADGRAVYGMTLDVANGIGKGCGGGKGKRRSIVPALL